MRTLMNKFFEFDFLEFEEYKNKFNVALLPKLTKDNYRVAMAKLFSPSNEINSNLVFIYFKMGVIVLPKKIADRTCVHKTLESIQEAIPKEILTSDLGGNEASITKLHNDWLQLCKKEENVKYFKEMANARTNEALRHSGKFNEEHLRTPGSFRKLNVD
ncbi:hypothetical protein K1T71_011319 [Dendrolimus kikuchii]|uniref:Uncharacterized protein n=1 Tax=Dendrolimus kikuchii TaxID=765133 RepID=A0ACC1CNM6_9NEOP|nr:hypothetical protein K1T71_011319 [Dendrolimus kikuchii]